MAEVAPTDTAFYWRKSLYETQYYYYWMTGDQEGKALLLALMRLSKKLPTVNRLHNHLGAQSFGYMNTGQSLTQEQEEGIFIMQGPHKELFVLAMSTTAQASWNMRGLIPGSSFTTGERCPCVTVCVLLLCCLKLLKHFEGHTQALQH